MFHISRQPQRCELSAIFCIFRQDFLLHSFLGNLPVKVWTQIDITFATPIFWRQEMTSSEHLLIHATTLLGKRLCHAIYLISPVSKLPKACGKYFWTCIQLLECPILPSRKMCLSQKSRGEVLQIFSGSPCGQERLNSNSRVAFDHQIVIIIIKIVFGCRNEKK